MGSADYTWDGHPGLLEQGPSVQEGVLQFLCRVLAQCLLKALLEGRQLP